MNVRSVVLVALLATSLSAVAQEPPAATKPAEKAESAATPAKSDAAKPQESQESKEAQAESKPTKDSAGTPQRFIPSEQVRADFDVSFPVDI